MKPPRCCICKKDFRSDPSAGALVSFKLTEEQKARKQHMREKRIIGHPPGRYWFCNTHLAAARKYKHMEFSHAKRHIQKESSWWYRLLPGK